MVTDPSGLHGPSADALAAVKAALAERLGTRHQPRRAARIGEDLFAVAGVLRGEPRLRRTLTDVSVDAVARSGLVRTLFGSKLDEISLEVAATAAAQRWSSPRDLADSLERVGVETTVRSAKDPGLLADELFAVRRLLVGTPGLRDAIGDPARSEADKRALLRQLLDGRVSEPTSLLLDQAFSDSHRSVDLAIEEYERVAASVQGERVATVRAARPLGAQELERLQQALSRQYGRAVHLDVVVDAGLIGGVRVEIGDDVIDGSVQSRLDEAERRLAG